MIGYTVPRAAITRASAVALLNHLIRPLQEGLGNRETEGLRGLEVDDKVKLRRLLNRKIIDLGSLQYPVAARRGVPMKFGSPYRVSHQAVGIGNGQEEGYTAGNLYRAASSVTRAR